MRPAAEVTLRFAAWAEKHPLGPGEIYNLNVPDLPEEQICGVRRASLAPMYMGKPAYARGTCDLGGEHFFYTMGENLPLEDPESDLRLLQAGWVTVTPLTWKCETKMDELDAE